MFRIPSLVLSCALIAAFLTAPNAFAAGEWRPVTRDELALTASSVEPGADAEAIFWEVQVEERRENGALRIRFDHYLRIKIFTAAGVERHAHISIADRPGTEFSDLRGRTITPDSTIVPLRKDAIARRPTSGSAAAGLGIQTVAFDGVVPGAILEYRYLETRFDRPSHELALPLQRDIPVRIVRYDVKPAPLVNQVMRQVAFNAETTPFTPIKGGYFTTTAQRIPAFVAEPHMPPEDQVRAWLLVYYTPDPQPDASEYWKDVGRRMAAAFESSTKPTRPIRALAASLAGSAPTEDEKLRRLHDYCRTGIRRLVRDAAPNAPKDPAPQRNESAAEVLDRKAGNAYGTNLLFAALARAAGFEVRLAAMASRDRIFFDPTIPTDYFIDTSDIVVRIDGTWRFFDPGDGMAPDGHLRWQEEGQTALFCDADSTRFIDTPTSAPEWSSTSRVGTFRLSNQGALEGDVRIVLTGHTAADRWRSEIERTAEQRVDDLRERVRERMGSSEITDVQLPDARDPALPCTLSYHIRVPDFARVEGKRLVLVPGFFTRGLPPEFPDSTRRHAVFFDYPWAENDSVRIELPAGYAIEESEPLKALKIEGIGRYLATLRLTSDARQLVYARTFHFGENGRTLFPVEGYPRLRQVFEGVRERDAHTLTLFDATARE